MKYILANFNERGLKIPRDVSREEAQRAYDAMCHAEQMKPVDLSTVTRPVCFCHKTFQDFLWVVA